MKLPDAGAMILDRKTSTCWKVEVSERRWLDEESDAYRISLECVTHNGASLDINEDDLHDDETRYVELEPLQVLEMAKHLTEQACSLSLPMHPAHPQVIGPRKEVQRQMCLKAIWLLQWFSADD